jgi:hypothetical protein
MTVDKVILTGYGTLLLQESLGNTIGKDGAESKKYKPIIIKNYKRLFNLLPEHYVADNRMFNGLCFEADAADLGNLDKRERYYKRSIVPYFDFYTGEELGLCNVYESPLDATWLCRDSSKLLPLWRDIVYARVGAYRIGEAFGKMYDATTFLADGKTLLVDYYEDWLKLLEDLESVLLQYKK